MTHLVWTAFHLSQCFNKDGTKMYRVCSDVQHDECLRRGSCHLSGHDAQGDPHAIGAALLACCRSVALSLRELTPNERKIRSVLDE